MTIQETPLAGLLLLQPRLFRDDRGWFAETFHELRYRDLGIPDAFVQDNVSHSRRNVLRGLHLQSPHPQGKLVSVVHGEVYDVAVDVRPDSPTFGQWYGATLSAENGYQLWIPPGFAHGFVVTGAEAVFLYKCTDFYAPHAELSIRWDDPDLGIEWPVAEPIVSPKDAAAPRLRDLASERLRSSVVEFA